MFTKIKTSQKNNHLKVTTKAVMIVVLVTSMMFVAVDHFANPEPNYKILAYAQDSESYVYNSTAANNMSKANSSTIITSPISVSPSKSIEKEFWINTMHLDGSTNLKAGIKCDNCPQNTPSHPAEQPPLNSTIPTGGGFKVTEPNKVGAWDFRAFAFSQSQIIVNQGDKVTLHFVGVQGAHHFIKIDGIGNFPLGRGQIQTVSFVASNPGTISYICTLHLPNMVGEILVMPKSV